jgi:outer membrane protein assembly factor BamA
VTAAVLLVAALGAVHALSAGPVREQPHLVLGPKSAVTRDGPARQAGHPVRGHPREGMNARYSFDQTPVRNEILREIRVHGNAYLTDAEVLAVAGVTVGDPLTADSVAAIEKRLKDSGRFETIEVRKRYRSLTDPTDVALVLVVHEKPGVVSATSPTAPVYTPWRRFRSRLMFLPILGYSDGYGFTYGARFSTRDLLGGGERLSFPLTWGGTRRAAVEFDRQFRAGPLTRVDGAFGIWQRENPRFEVDDRRIEVKGRAEKEFATILRLSAEASHADVHFASPEPLNDRLWTVGTNVAVDTRGNPAFPRNAFYLGAGWTGLHVDDDPGINRYTAEARGYVGIFRQVVLAARVQYTGADATLPPYERLLLGAAPTVRGYSPGSFDGDKLLVTSAEVRVPVTSVISGGQFGVTAFFDAGKIIEHDGRFGDVPWQRGVGGGVFLIASIFRINLDVGYGLDGKKTRLHLATGFSF